MVNIIKTPQYAQSYYVIR